MSAIRWFDLLDRRIVPRRAEPGVGGGVVEARDSVSMRFQSARSNCGATPLAGVRDGLFGHDRARRPLDARAVRAEPADREDDAPGRLLARPCRSRASASRRGSPRSRAARALPRPRRAARRRPPGPRRSPRGCAARGGSPRSRRATARAAPSTAGTPRAGARSKRSCRATSRPRRASRTARRIEGLAHGRGWYREDRGRVAELGFVGF